MTITKHFSHKLLHERGSLAVSFTATCMRSTVRKMLSLVHVLNKMPRKLSVLEQPDFMCL